MIGRGAQTFPPFAARVQFTPHQRSHSEGRADSVGKKTPLIVASDRFNSLNEREGLR